MGNQYSGTTKIRPLQLQEAGTGPAKSHAAKYAKHDGLNLQPKALTVIRKLFSKLAEFHRINAAAQSMIWEGS